MRERGGRLYVWKCSTRCCRGRFDWLESSTEPRSGSEFRLAAANGLEVHVPTTLRELPDELHVELKRFPRRHLVALDARDLLAGALRGLPPKLVGLLLAREVVSMSLRTPEYVETARAPAVPAPMIPFTCSAGR